ncbi:MAG: LysR family transcriptional regulator [Clostridiales bacterium]|nr:LysR family transcriptional regulator [Clostridiales bacterium]
MNFESLKFFYKIAVAGNISSVAKEAHISQSALSQQINKLESSFTGKLLERSNKGVTLTPKGEIVLKFAENILRTYDEMLDEISRMESGDTLIKVEACNSLANYALPCTLMLAKKQYPRHKYELKSRSSADIATDVANNICDIGFSYMTGSPSKHADVVSIKTGVNNIVLVGKNTDVNPDMLSIEQLLNACIITFTGRNDIDDILSKNLKKLGFERKNLNCQMEVEGLEGAKMMISHNYGIAFLPYIAVKEELYKKEFKIIDVPKFNMDLQMLILFKKNHPLQVDEFISWFIKKGTKSFC